MSERKTINKWYWVWEFDKEERWLNEMAMQGWALCGVGFCRYTFERCEPGEYTVRLEMRKYDPEYVSFLSEIGAEYIGRVVSWIYFRKRAEDGPFDLFDLDAKIDHLSRIARMLWIIGLANLLIGIVNTLNVSGIGVINLLCATLLMYALGRIEGKKEALVRERELHE
jgi:hypothetical protein